MYHVSGEEGRFKVEIKAEFIGEDLLIWIYGGTEPHIGALSLALPRPSLEYEEKISSTASVITRVGHKDDIVAKMVGEDIASFLNRVVVVTAGIHWDLLAEEDLKQVNSAARKAMGTLKDELKGCIKKLSDVSEKMENKYIRKTWK